MLRVRWSKKVRGSGHPGKGNWSSQGEGDREGSPEEVWCSLFKRYGNDIQEWAKLPTC